ncbi:MAG: TetR/AcrR family transcriptional regulator [Thermomicrobiales bacterium]
MSDDVKPSGAKRRYDAPHRRAAADRTRRTIFRAASDLFTAQGYAATTMPAIAREAGVALDTVYAVAGPKPALLRQLIESAISGQDQAIPAEERDYVREIREEPDPRLKLALYARAVAQIQPRLAPLFAVLRDAAPHDEELAALWAEISSRRAANMRRLVDDVTSAGRLREGITRDDAADLIWATNSPDFYLLLAGERGWSPEKLERWLADLWIRTLLP